MITLIVPTYRAPDYLDLCLRTATQGRAREDTKIVVIIDGYVQESMPIVEKYDNINVIPLEKNMGMAYAINVGVYSADTPFVFVVNDDNVFGPRWDERIGRQSEKWVITVNQVEPSPSIFGTPVKDFGRTAKEFRLNEWWEYEPTIADRRYTDDGRVFPFIISKKMFMAVGGFDLYYDSPFFVDCDFWLKLEMLDCLTFKRWHGTHLYHFASASTKNRKDSEAEVFRKSERVAAQQFLWKWGFIPDILNSAKYRNNTKLPRGQTIKGINF